MAKAEFHEKPYDEGTLSKLDVFELYIREWIPVFLSEEDPRFREIHIFDFFSGPGSDPDGILGSPLRILKELRSYYDQGLKGWGKVKIVAHFFDQDSAKIDSLSLKINNPLCQTPGVEIDLQILPFRQALESYRNILENPGLPKLLIIDQFGVDEVSDEVFKFLIKLSRTDFLFFIASSTLHRFRDHPAIKQKIAEPEDSYAVHRMVFDYYKKIIPSTRDVFLGQFSIRKRSNIYGLIFGSSHPLGIKKFLDVCWNRDRRFGEANFDIERDSIHPDELLLNLDEMRPNKVRNFEIELEKNIVSGSLVFEGDLIRFCFEYGMTLRHSSLVLKKLKKQGVIDIDFRIPDISKIKHSRRIRIKT